MYSIFERLILISGDKSHLNKHAISFTAVVHYSCLRGSSSNCSSSYPAPQSTCLVLKFVGIIFLVYPVVNFRFFDPTWLPSSRISIESKHYPHDPVNFREHHLIISKNKNSID